MRRQAHDRWGISKIVLVYCDDFLKRVYTFPWFQEPEWKQVGTAAASCASCLRRGGRGGGVGERGGS